MSSDRLASELVVLLTIEEGLKFKAKYKGAVICKSADEKGTKCSRNEK